MATIQPPTILNSFREQPIDKTGLQSPVSRPRTNQNLEEQVQAANAKPKPQSADQVMLSPEAKQVSAKPSVMKVEIQPAEQPQGAGQAQPAQPPLGAVQLSATEAAKGKPINLLV